jgi:chaperonin cofactor prefoldin
MATFQKRMSMMNPKVPSEHSEELSLNDPDRVNQLYVAVLDHLLTPPHVKEQLMESQSLEKKFQMINMHNHLFESMNSWGDKENMLLTSIQKMKLPDIPTLSRLKTILATGNFEMMTSFLENGGVSILLKAIENRINKKPITELDIAILFEILSCFKAIMKNSLGMDGVAQVAGSIDILAKCLRFEYKQFALQVLEILSVCAFYSEENAMKVLHGMKVNARFYQEAPFHCLSQALLEQDIEMKAAVLQFVNQLIMSIGDTKLRLVLRSELKSTLFDEQLELSLQQVDKEIALLATTEKPPTSPNPSNNNVSLGDVPKDASQRKLVRKSMVTVFGPRAYDERKVEAMVKNVAVLNATLSDTGSILGHQIEIKSKDHSVMVNPLEGTMAGLLHAAKNTEKMESRFLDMVGGKKTKRRWYELDAENFKWCSGHDKESDYKGTVKVSSMTDIRPYTTDVNVAQECQHCFEIETTERTYAVGAETATEKDNWLTALQRCRDNYLMSKGSYKLQFHELSTADVIKFANSFKQRVENYQMIATEDLKNQMELVGLDLTDLSKISRYLTLESIAMGNGNTLMKVFYELLLIPAGSEGLWEGILHFLKIIREKGMKEESKINSLLDTNETRFLELLKKKFKESGNAYTQMSKIALNLVSAEQEVNRLQKQLEDCQKTISELQETMKTALVTGNAFKSENPIMSMGKSGNNDSSEANNSSPTKTTLPNKRAARVLGSKRLSIAPPPPPVPGTTTTAPPTVDVTPSSEVSFSPSLSAPPMPPVPTAVIATGGGGSIDPKFEKYDKMKKMLPEGAVRQKMNLDGFSEEEIEAFFNGTLPTVATTSAPAVPPPVAPPAVAAASVATVDPRFEKYEKMKKMLPEGAVRQKMNLDGFSHAEIEGFFNGTLPMTVLPPLASVAPTVTAAIDPKFEKYEKMKKMLPEGAVRQKMNLEGISAEEIDAFFHGTLGQSAAPAPPAQAAAAGVVDPRYEKFEKMKKMLPEGAVRQKMNLEGFTPEEIDNFMAGKVPMIGGGGAAAPPAAPAAPLDPRFEKFDKMRKMLPEGAVRQKMSLEGFTPEEIDKFFSGAATAGGGGGTPAGSPMKSAASPLPPAPKLPPKPVEEEPPEGMKKKEKIKPSTKLRGLFWNKIKSNEITKDMIWFQLKDFPLTNEEIRKLEDNFANQAKEPSSPMPTSAKESSKSNQPKLTSVLDGKRTQNILILLGKLRKAPEDVLMMIIELDPTVLHQEITNSLMENVPTAEGMRRCYQVENTFFSNFFAFFLLEITAIKAFSSPTTLDIASQLIYHLNRIPKLSIRLECHELAFSWEINAKTSSSQMSILLKGCQEFQQLKDPFQRLMAMMLAIGNYLNGDTARGQVKK